MKVDKIVFVKISVGVDKIVKVDIISKVVKIVGPETASESFLNDVTRLKEGGTHFCDNM